MDTVADMKPDELDNVLDAALAKYAAEPRTGLEERVLANLRDERARIPSRAWWRWSVMAALAAMVVVAVALAWRSVKATNPTVANHPGTIHAPALPAKQVVSNKDGNQVRNQERKAIRSTTARQERSGTAMAGNPKLAQFPSPQPLSEQERILASYVADDPKRARLIARVISEGLRQDQLEEMKAFPAGNRGRDSERNSETTGR